jgi:hypothetical protein
MVTNFPGSNQSTDAFAKWMSQEFAPTSASSTAGEWRERGIAEPALLVRHKHYQHLVPRIVKGPDCRSDARPARPQKLSLAMSIPGHAIRRVSGAASRTRRLATFQAQRVPSSYIE